MAGKAVDNTIGGRRLSFTHSLHNDWIELRSIRSTVHHSVTERYLDRRTQLVSLVTYFVVLQLKHHDTRLTRRKRFSAMDIPSVTVCNKRKPRESEVTCTAR